MNESPLLQTFEQRVAEVDARLRAIDGAQAGEIVLERRAPESATWKRGAYWTTLTLHESPARMELTLHSRDAQHPDALEIAPDDADAVEMIARPAADFLAGAPEAPHP